MNGIHLTRVIDTIIIHHSATPPDMNIGAEKIRDWHIERGFNDIGYHEVIRPDGRIEAGRNRNEPGAHCKGHNRNSVGICMVGDGRAGFTDAQYAALGGLLRFYRRLIPDVQIAVHRDYAETICPGMSKNELLEKVRL